MAHSALNVVYTFVHDLLMMLYHTVESFAAFLGASVHFVLSKLPRWSSQRTALTAANLALLLLLVVGYLVYARNTRTVRRDQKKVA